MVLLTLVSASVHVYSDVRNQVDTRVIKCIMPNISLACDIKYITPNMSLTRAINCKQTIHSCCCYDVSVMVTLFCAGVVIADGFSMRHPDAIRGSRRGLTGSVHG